jgi:hypothetical protein
VAIGALRNTVVKIMCRIRPLVEHDLADVALLYSKIYRDTMRSSSDVLQSYFREVLLQNPWRDMNLPSWVYEDHGKIVGVIGIIPRRMSFEGKPLRMAVGCSLFVDPEYRNTLAGLYLMQKFMAGPQDVTLIDGPSRIVQRIWQRLGGEVLPFHNLRWLRPLRPARTILGLCGRRSRSGKSGMSARPRVGLYLGGLLCDCVDLAIMPLVPRLEPPAANLQAQPLDAPILLSCLSEFRQHYRFRPEYDLGELHWLLDQLERKKRYGPLQKVVIRCARRGIVGWYLYYLNSTEFCEVLQIGARADTTEEVLNHLFDHARRRGAAALHGRVEPRLVQALSDQGCIFHGRASNILFHTRNPEARAAVLAGDGLLTRVEGEWWLRFTGETLDKN